MRVAHFAIFAPHGSGQYETVRDLVIAERMVGIDAGFVDCGAGDGYETRQGLSDGEVETRSMEWAEKADIAIRHSVVPPRIFSKMPVVLAIHGRPESSFQLERYGKAAVISALSAAVRAKQYAGAITFWPELVYPWQCILGDIDICLVPAPVNFETYKPKGDKYRFGDYAAGINIIITDVWRDDRFPLNLVFAAQYFRDHYYPDTKLHLFGAPVKEKALGFLGRMQRDGVIGQVAGTVKYLDVVYRSADMLLTPNTIATRVVREALASGCPVVAPTASKHTQFRAPTRDPAAFAAAMRACYETTNSRAVRNRLRTRAMARYGLKSAGEGMVQALRRFAKSPARPAISVVGGKTAYSMLDDDIIVLGNFARHRKIQSVVEFGPGRSTRLFEKLGLNIRAYETDAKYAEAVRKETRANIVMWDGKKRVPVEADLAVIDGPHKSIGRRAAFGSVAAGDVAYVAIHDTNRSHEKRLMEEFFSGWTPITGTNHMVILGKEAA